jgi:hypothetical protein
VSVEQLAVVLHHSQAKGTDKLVLIGIANHAGDGGAWPAVATLARYANVQPRMVQKSLARLVELGEVTRYVQAGGLAGWQDFLRPNRYDVTVECPEWCDRSSQHRPRDGWAFDDAGQVVRTETLPLSTGDTPEVQNRATRRKHPLSNRTPGVPQDTPPVSHRTPEPSTNQPDRGQVSASATEAAAVPADDVDLSTVRDQLRHATEQHDRRERGDR